MGNPPKSQIQSIRFEPVRAVSVRCLLEALSRVAQACLLEAQARPRKGCSNFQGDLADGKSPGGAAGKFAANMFFGLA